VIYYHVLELEALLRAEIPFRSSLGGLFSESDQKAILALWYVDSIGLSHLRLPLV
jgi:hypothetical protein